MARILFIEECGLFRETMEYCLPRLGHVVMTAADEVEARRLASEQEMDVVVLDLDVPAGSGFSTCESLKRDGRFAEVPIVVLTALITPDVSARALAAGAAGLVAKPFQWDLLLGLIERVVSAPSAPSPLFPIACAQDSPPSCTGRENPGG